MYNKNFEQENEMKPRVPTSVPRRQKPVKTSSKIVGIFFFRHSFTRTRWKSGSTICIPPAPCITAEQFQMKNGKIATLV